jgi:transcriptional regulator with XRE-family HTH domain
VKTNEQNNILKAVGENLRKFRKAKGLTMEALASEAEIEYRQLGRIERGEINTTILSLMKLTDVLDIELFKLFQFDSE